MTNIFTRSPYIIEIDEVGQIATKVELYISSGADSLPTSPSYSISKSIPSSNASATYLDISPYIRENINFDSIVSGYSSSIMNVNTFGRVQVKRYKDVGAGFVLIDTTIYYCFDGYSYYEDGGNYDLGRSMMTEGNYHYNYDSSIDLTTDFNLAPGTIGVPLDGATSEEYKATYTNLSSGASVSVVLSNLLDGGGTYNFPRQFPTVYSTYYADGNKLEIIDNNTTTVLGTYYFYPKEQCKHTPVKLDFVNKFGQYQRIWFYGASFDSTEVISKEFNGLQTIPSYNTLKGQRSEYNINGKDKIKINSDWVAEDFENVIKEIMLSEKILVNDLPAKLNTKSIQRYKHINQKMINYELDFTYNFDIINTIS